MQAVRGFGFDDLLLEPRHSRLTSRLDVSFSVHIPRTGIYLSTPIFSSPMDTVTESEMAIFMSEWSAIGVIHRYMSIDEQVAQVRKVKKHKEVAKRYSNVGASVGVNGSEERTRALLDAGVDFITIDVAHGDSKAVLGYISWLRGIDEHISIMSGNIASRGGARNCIEAGVDMLRVGVGAGSACTTRLVAGVGVPQLTAIERAAEVAMDYDREVLVVADGGIKHSGDIVKAMAAGADAVMLGGMLSGYAVAPRPGEYRGMASRAALTSYKGRLEVSPEGESFLSNVIEDCEEHFGNLVAAVQQGFAYLGATSTKELRESALWIEVSPLGHRESAAHFNGD